MGKKAARGAFFFFMLDFQSKHGTKHKMEALQRACAQEWQVDYFK
jgi:hypothetical protein